MIELRVILNGDGAMPELADTIKAGKLHELHSFAVSALPHGTQSGHATVMFFANMPDGTLVTMETTMRLFLTAAAAFRARYGDNG